MSEDQHRPLPGTGYKHLKSARDAEARCMAHLLSDPNSRVFREIAKHLSRINPEDNPCFDGWELADISRMRDIVHVAKNVDTLSDLLDDYYIA